MPYNNIVFFLSGALHSKVCYEHGAILQNTGICAPRLLEGNFPVTRPKCCNFNEKSHSSAQMIPEPSSLSY